MYVGSPHPARHTVVVDDGQERPVGAGHARGHQQQARGHRGGARRGGDVGEIGRYAVQVVRSSAAPVADLDRDVVIAVHGDRRMQRPGGGGAVVQQPQGRVPRLGLCRHLQRCCGCATHRVVQHARIKDRVLPFAAGDLQSAQPRVAGRRLSTGHPATAECETHADGAESGEVVAPPGGGSVVQPYVARYRERNAPRLNVRQSNARLSIVAVVPVRVVNRGRARNVQGFDAEAVRTRSRRPRPSPECNS